MNNPETKKNSPRKRALQRLKKGSGAVVAATIVLGAIPATAVTPTPQLPVQPTISERAEKVAAKLKQFTEFALPTQDPSKITPVQYWPNWNNWNNWHNWNNWNNFANWGNWRNF